MLLHLRPPPPGATRLDHTTPKDPVELIRRLALAVDALEAAGTTAPALTRTGVWLDEHGDAFVDPAEAPASGESSAARLALLLCELAPRAARHCEPALTRAREGAYFSAGQFAAELPVAKRHSWLAGVLKT